METSSSSVTQVAIYPKTGTALIKKGSVAERISQLQAKLSPKKVYLPISPGRYRGPVSPTASALSRYSISKLLLSPESIPLPETPAHIRMHHTSSNESFAGQEKQRAAFAKRSSMNEQSDHIAEAINEGDGLGHPETSKYEHEIGLAREEYQHQAGPQDVQQDVTSRKSFMESGSCFLFTPAKNPSPSSKSDPKWYMSRRSTEYDLGKSEESGRRGKYSKILQRQGTDVDMLSEASKKSPHASAGGAYSKILPFMLDRSFSSYIPRRQSPSHDNSEEISPTRLRKMDSTETVEPSTSTSPRLSPSPRQRDRRSLRRRTFSPRLEDMSHEAIGDPIHGHQEPHSVPTSTTLEDVFNGPSNQSKPYQVEPSILTANTGPSSSESLHDIHNPKYIPSVMPRRPGSRPMLKSRHKRSNQASMAQMLTTRVQPVQYQTHTRSKSSRGEDLDIDNVSTTTGTESGVISKHHPDSRSSSSSSNQKTSGNDPRVSAKDNTAEESQVRDPSQSLLTGDGVGSEYESDWSLGPRRQIVNVTVLGSPCSSKSKIPRPVGMTEAEAQSSQMASPRIKNTFTVHRVQMNRGRGLRVVVTMEQRTKDAVKIEVHPSPKSHILSAYQDKHDQMEREPPTINKA